MLKMLRKHAGALAALVGIVSIALILGSAPPTYAQVRAQVAARATAATGDPVAAGGASLTVTNTSNDDQLRASWSLRPILAQIQGFNLYLGGRPLQSSLLPASQQYVTLTDLTRGVSYEPGTLVVDVIGYMGAARSPAPTGEVLYSIENTSAFALPAKDNTFNLGAATLTFSYLRSGEVMAAWNPKPVRDRQIQGFRVSVDGAPLSSELLSPSVRTTSLSQLIPGMTYPAGSVSVEVVGYGGAPRTPEPAGEVLERISNGTSLTMPSKVLDGPKQITVDPDGTSATVFWAADPIASGYQLYRNGALVNTAPILGTSYRIVGLTPSTSYQDQFQLASIRRTVSDRLESDRMSLPPFDTREQDRMLPPVPIQVSLVKPEVDALTIGWEAGWGPADSGRPPVTEYRVYVSGALVGTVPASTRVYRIANLPSYTPYLAGAISVAAVNSAGESLKASPADAMMTLPSAEQAQKIASRRQLMVGATVKKVSPQVVEWRDASGKLLKSSVVDDLPELKALPVGYAATITQAVVDDLGNLSNDTWAVQRAAELEAQGRSVASRTGTTSRLFEDLLRPFAELIAQLLDLISRLIVAVLNFIAAILEMIIAGFQIEPDEDELVVGGGSLTVTRTSADTQLLASWTLRGTLDPKEGYRVRPQRVDEWSDDRFIWFARWNHRSG